MSPNVVLVFRVVFLIQLPLKIVNGGKMFALHPFFQTIQHVLNSLQTLLDAEVGDQYVVLIEDCVFSGNQSSRLLDDYFDRKDSKRYKVSLTEQQKNRFKSMEGVIQFLIGRNRGVTAVEEKVAELGMNVRVQVEEVKYGF